MSLSRFFGFSRRRSIPSTTDRRAEERYEAYHPVTVSLAGLLGSVAGTVINVFLSGAAVHVPGWRAKAPAEWLAHLKRGDELQLSGLFDVPVPCSVVTADGGVIRVQFARDDGLRGQLRELINSMAALTFFEPSQCALQFDVY
jgi:hypothetical protein